MLHKLSLDTDSMAISYYKYRNRCTQIYLNLASKYCQNTTHDKVLSNSMVQPMKIKMMCIQLGFPSKSLV